MHQPLRSLHALRAPLLIVLLLLALTLPSLLGCACGGFSLLPVLTRANCTPPPPVVTPTASGRVSRSTHSSHAAPNTPIAPQLAIDSTDYLLGEHSR